MNLKDLLNIADAAAAKGHLELFGEQGGLSCFLFHAIFKDESELAKQQIYPQECMTVVLFRQFIEYFLDAGYQFITPDEIKAGLPDKNKKYGLITFDDGYYNNTLILDVLTEYKVPAVFFIATAYVQEGKKFWSDALYAGRKKTGIGDEAVLEEIMSLKKMRVADINRYLIEHFSKDALKPLSDIDRPFTPAELAVFAHHPYVHIGNHTHEHEVLTNLTIEEVTEEFKVSQQLIKSWTGIVPDFISYPNGSYSQQILEAARQNNFTMGISTVAQKNRLPLSTAGFELLGRFNPVAVGGQLELAKFRSSLQLKTGLKKWLQ